MDNLYNSDEFFEAAYNHEQITDSWCYEKRKERHPAICYTRGIEVKKAQIDTRGTEKEVVLEGDPKCTNLIEASMYDTMVSK